MSISAVSFQSLSDTINKNNFLRKITLIGEPVYEKYYNKVEQENKIKFPDCYKKFVFEISIQSQIEWRINESNIDQLGFSKGEATVGGRIVTMGPKEMIKDSKGEYWEGVFWFKELHTELNDRFKRFVPFDLSDGQNYTTGFMKEGNDVEGWVISDQLYLNIQNRELIPHPFTFEEYLEFIVKSKGYIYLLGFYNAPISENFEQFMRVMPKLFDDFDEKYFIELSKKK